MEAETERRMGATMIRYAKSPQDIAAEIVFSNFNKSPSNLERSIADAIESDRKWAALAQSDAEPVVDEDAVDAAFDTWAKPRGYRNGNRLSFHAGVEFGLRHSPERLNADVRALRQQIEHYHGKWGKRDD
jgi:hypothetical protein